MAQSGKQHEDAAPVRLNRPEPVGRNAGILGNAAFLRAGFRDPTLVLHWEEIVGTDVARIAQPLRMVEGVAGGVLTLKADPAAALFLQHESRSLCERINAYLGRSAVHRVRFVQCVLANGPAIREPKLALPDTTSDDPARRFSGPEPLGKALLELARARRRPRD